MRRLGATAPALRRHLIANLHQQLLGALFDYPFAADAVIPEALKEGQAVLIGQITGPLMALTQVPEEEAARHARVLFSAVHGIVKLSLEQRFAALNPGALRQQLRRFLEVYLSQF